ncbi:energy-coupling factor transporter transmembrane protein EcfT [Ornithinibacillus massiliensis]|uniref:Energy-coupling factor transporter transmembrane protein EcfT n=1 Tax=Ornithinibacillus massiliensis TaxID=1944633 RepID=A0ABS5MDA7_9BACI|nr:energy-coupling factor transporter transmembrane component T [Ornithinibacillus massiliensis]MBS3680306.1 energy-coupling factor transporter transmembrane protein EcfT [Ornithinibacillus massiliensis]
MISSINPAIKAIAILIPGVLLGLMYDVMTPLLYFVFIISITFLFTTISFKKWIKMFAPFLFLVLGLAWMTMLYTSGRFSGGDVLFHIFMFEIQVGSVLTAISLALRSLCFVSLSLLFALTTDSTKFMLSLMQQCKLPPRITYGILAGYRFLPTFKQEFDTIRKAHRIRGVGRATGIKERLHQFRRYIIPLLANGIRRAERVAIAMESKGFTGDPDRTYYRELKVKKRDWLFLLMMVGVLLGIMVLSYYLGYFNIMGYKIKP